MQRFGASQRQTCALLQLSRTVYRYESVARDQSALEMRIKEITEVRVHYDEREALAGWLAVYREGQARTEARAMLASAPAQLESLVSALEVAADTMSAAEADGVWAQLQAIARTLKRAGQEMKTSKVTAEIEPDLILMRVMMDGAAAELPPYAPDFPRMPVAVIEALPTDRTTRLKNIVRDAEIYRSFFNAMTITAGSDNLVSLRSAVEHYASRAKAELDELSASA
jgi:hypothetical protein